MRDVAGILEWIFLQRSLTPGTFQVVLITHLTATLLQMLFARILIIVRISTQKFCCFNEGYSELVGLTVLSVSCNEWSQMMET